jgi:cyanophycinase
MRRTFPTHLLVALLVGVAGCVSATRLSLGPPIENANPSKPKGCLLIVGGGGTTANMYQRAIEIGSRDGDAKVVIFPQASELPDTGESSAAVWREAGVPRDNVLVADVKNEKRTRELVESATIIWFPGGVQKRLMDALGKDLPALIRKRYQEGALVGGTSAGAAVMSSTMITGDYVSENGDEGGLSVVQGNTVQTDQGLGLIDWAIVDQHFFKRRRFNRLLSCVLDNHTKLIGIGIDERTAILVQEGSHFEVIGENNVLVIDARHVEPKDIQVKEGLPSSALGLKVSLLTHGMSFDARDRD